MNQYNVCIIGCGSIGATKPDHIDYPGSPNILTHGNAVDRHPQTNLVAVIDVNDGPLLKAKTKWQAWVAVKSFDELIVSGKEPDIVIVATPTKFHYDVLHQIFINNVHQMPKLIIAEKPFCSNLDTARAITESYSNMGIPIMVDYIRRFAKGYQKIKKQIDDNVFGKALNARVLYTRGLRHEGCHAIDLMRYFFGECLTSDSNYALSIIDRDKNDPSIPISFTFLKCGSVTFQPCDGRQYGIFEVDICFEKARLRFIDNGLYLEQYPINEENEWGHKSLDYSLTNVIRTETGLNTALYELINNAVRFLDGKEDLICTASDAVKVHEILEGLG